jgi:hypothetical protein
MALVGFWQRRRKLFTRSDISTVFFYLLLNTLLWLAIGFVAQHDYHHNLYWKWLYVLVPFWMMFAADAIAASVNAFRSRLAVRLVVMLALATGTGYSFFLQTEMQLDMSDRLYRPQVEVAQWVEANVPEGTTMIFDNIPACYIDRKPHSWNFISWFDVTVPPGDESAMEKYIVDHKIKYVLWFKEDWTQAPMIAPYLAEPIEHTIGRFHFVPMFHEEEYGFIFYRIENAP